MSILQRGEKRRLADIGATVPLQARVEFEMQGLDISVFGLSNERKLEDDRYLVFYNQLESPRRELSVALTPNSAAFTLDLAALPETVSRLMFTATHDSEPVKSAKYLRFELGDVSFEPVSALAEERALMIAELYLHGGEWRVAAVGQGFNGGLKALLEYFGGEAAEDDAPQKPAQTKPEVAAVPQAAAPVAPSRAVELAPEPVQSAPAKTVNLQKSQSVSLSKMAPSLRRVAFGLGWDPAARGRSVDLDGSCIAFDSNKKVLETIWFGHLRSRDGTIAHSGDNLTGRGAGDDEVIRVELERLPPTVQTLVFTINSFTGQRFSSLKNAFCRVVDEDTRFEMARYDLGAGGNVTGMIMAKVERGPEGWTMTALGEPAGGLTVHFLVKAVRKVI